MEEKMTKEYDSQGILWLGGKRGSLTVTEYATKHGISRQTALWRIKKGKVKATQIQLGGKKSVWLIED